MNKDSRIQQAIDVFKDHHLIYESEDRWIIARKYPDGKIKNNYLTEIISLYGGRLFVGGDIDDVVFAYNNTSPKGKLAWIGCEESDFHYLCEKAQIGMTDGGLLTYVYDEKLAREELKERKKKYIESNEQGYVEIINEAITEVDDREECISILYSIGDAWEWVGQLGMKVSLRVIYAWAAVNKLYNLLEVKYE